MHTPDMTPLRPYLVRALLDWINSNDMKPHVLVDATVPGVQVPPQAVQDGKVVLNVSPTAVQNMTLEPSALSFQARFGGSAQNVVLPMESLVAIYANETGVGMQLPVEATTQPMPTPPSPPKDRRAHLRVVK